MKNIIGISALLSALLASFCSVAPSFAQSGCVHTGYFGQLSSWNSGFSLNGESAAYVSGPCNPSTRRCQTVEVQRAGADAVFGTTDDSSEYMFFQLPFDVYEVQLLDASRLAVSTAFESVGKTNQSVKRVKGCQRPAMSVLGLVAEKSQSNLVKSGLPRGSLANLLVP